VYIYVPQNNLHTFRPPRMVSLQPVKLDGTNYMVFPLAESPNFSLFTFLSPQCFPQRRGHWRRRFSGLNPPLTTRRIRSKLKRNYWISPHNTLSHQLVLGSCYRRVIMDTNE